MQTEVSDYNGMYHKIAQFIINYLVGCEIRKNNMYIFVMLFLISVFGVISTSQADKLYNPKPYDDDFILPMPNGAKMVFRRVFLDTGSKPFDFQEMTLGYTEDKIYEYPTKVRFGGSFVEKNPQNGDDGWMFYIGKYEVTKDQYYSVMDKSKMTGSQEPITKISWFDAQGFIHKFNLWLFENASDDLPENGGVPGYLRLPSEIEWEFVARGGSVVSDDVFKGKYPYPEGTFNKFEWFAGPDSSHGKVKNIGKRESNPLKVHDMLGNVLEMTSSSYHVEYYQGRTGGFVARGGSSKTQKKEMRSSLRSEMPYYKNSEALKQETLGIRLLISSQIFAKGTKGKQEEAWPEYLRKYRVAPDTLIFSTQSVTAQTNYQLKDAIDTIKKLSRALEPYKGDQTVGPWIALVGNVDKSFQNIKDMVRDSESDKALAYIKNASENAYLLCKRDFIPMRIKNDVLNNLIERSKKDPRRFEKTVDKLRVRIKEYKDNIDDTLKSYIDQLKDLVKIKDEIVNDAFVKHMNKLKKNRATGDRINAATLVKVHYKDKVFYKETLEKDFKVLSKSFKGR